MILSIVDKQNSNGLVFFWQKKKNMATWSIRSLLLPVGCRLGQLEVTQRPSFREQALHTIEL